MAEGLSDALRQMADGEHRPPGQQRDDTMDQARPTTAASSDHTPVFDESGAYAGAEAMPSAERRAASPPPGGRTFKLAAAALLFAMGLVMAAMGSWATMILAGHEVWRSDQPGARTVALALLVTYPIAMLLLGVATVLFRRGVKSR